MYQPKTIWIVALGGSLLLLSGCASMDDMKRLEQTTKDATEKAEQALAAALASQSEAEKALAAAQASQSEAAKATQKSDAAVATTIELKTAVENLKKNPYMPEQERVRMPVTTP